MNSPSPSGVTKEARFPKRPDQRDGARTAERSMIGALVGRLEIRMLGLALLLGITLTVLSPHFLTSNNLLNVLDQSVVVGIVSIGMTFVILIGGIDLSVGSVAGCTGVLLGRGLEHLPIPLAIFLAILAGCGIGLFSGVLIARFGLPAFVVTLGVMAIGRSLAYIFSGATSIADLPESFGNIVYTNVFGIPAHVLTLLVLYALSWGYLNFTKGGRTIYAIGSNHEAARTAGLNVLAFSILPYVISGGLSAGAITFASAQVMSIDPLAGTGLELDAIAAVVIGGASLYGGRGSIIGTLIGVLIMVMIRNGLNLLNVSPFWQGSAIGAVIITAVLIERVLSSRSS
jgi:ribose transport system permease protein